MSLNGKDAKERRPTSLSTPATPAAAAGPQQDWDKPGVLSIVVQGALFQGNLVEAATHCQHWRDLFPAAQIVFVVSVTDVVTGTLDGHTYTDLRLVARHRHDGHLQAALSAITRACDAVALAEPALPLPPIKRDSPKLNNVNFQIAAARRGLAMVTGTYVLRIRSDMLFMDRGFLSQYLEGRALPRGDAAAFAQRVMISWLYTLNPFTVERMPLHFSDWFNFGLTEDVRKIWAVPFLTLKDAIHYKTRPHAPDSNTAERLFDVRIAVEQHVMYHCFKPMFPQLELGYHNDRSSIDLAMDILIDNFVLCDLVEARCVFDKYAHEFHDLAKRVHCITPVNWRAMAQERATSRAASRGPTPYRLMLSTEATQSAAATSGSQPQFPLQFDAHRLKTRVGEVADGSIVARARDGVLFYGPYVGLRSGGYTATVHVASLEGPGSLTLAVTVNGGNTVLAKRSFPLRGRAPARLELGFHVAAPFVSELEVVGTMKGVRSMTVSGVSIAEGTPPDTSPGRPSILRSVLGM